MWSWGLPAGHYRVQKQRKQPAAGEAQFGVQRIELIAIMEEAKNKEKTTPDKNEEKEKQPAGKDKDKKEDQELVGESEAVPKCFARKPS